MSTQAEVSSQSSDISRRRFMTRGPAAVGVAAAAAGCSVYSDPAPGVSFAKHQLGGKGEGRLRVAACQILTYPDVAESTEKIVHWIETAAGDKVDVVLFPEACLCGYAPKDYWKTADPEAFKKGEARVVEVAKRLGIAVVLGTVHWESGKILNDLLIVDKGGVVRGRYSKTHLAESWPVPGKVLPVHTVAGVPSCFIICHDVRYPELVRLPAVAGARICYFSSHESGLTREYKLSAYRAMPISRATENGIFLVMANAPTDPKTFRGSHGNSKIIHPDGNVLEEAGYFEERLVAADVRLKDATGGIARRAAKDDTILKAWLNEGVQLVDVGD